MLYDCVIRGGRIIDGGGGAPYFADLAIKDGKIAAIGGGFEAKSVIDAGGLTVSPGFIDSHSHADNAILTHPEMREKLEQGITTAIAGQCGTSPAPRAENGGIRTMGEFLRQARGIPLGCHIACFVGHNAIRRTVLGMQDRAPDGQELRQMCALLREALEGGAYGMSLGLYYAPGSYAGREELLALTEVLAERDGVLSAHIRSESRTALEAGEELLSLARASGVRTVHSHVKATGEENAGKLERLLEGIDRANAEGARVWCDVYPYTAAHTSLSASFVPRSLHADGRLLENLRDPAKRELAKEHVRQIYRADEYSWVLVVSAKNRPDCIGKTLSEIASERGCDPLDAAYDIILDSGNAAGACTFRMRECDVRRALSHPRAMLCTDASVAKGSLSYHPRLRAAFPRAIGRYARDEGLVPLPEIIRRATALPAEVYGLAGKGRIREGYDADLVLFDAERFIDRAEYLDCTAGCEGLRFVLVAGEVAVLDGVANGTRKGRLLLRTENS